MLSSSMTMTKSQVFNFPFCFTDHLQLQFLNCHFIFDLVKTFQPNLQAHGNAAASGTHHHLLFPPHPPLPTTSDPLCHSHPLQPPPFIWARRRSLLLRQIFNSSFSFTLDVSVCRRRRLHLCLNPRTLQDPRCPAPIAPFCI